MRPVVQIVRFYIINKFTGSRSIESLMDNPKYNSLLMHCVNTVMHYPDWAIEQCHKYRDEIDKRKFRFNSGKWAMDLRDEDLPKGTELDPVDLKNAFMDIINWINKNRVIFTRRIAEYERKRNE